MYFPAGLRTKHISQQDLNVIAIYSATKLQRTFTSNQGWKYTYPETFTASVGRDELPAEVSWDFPEETGAHPLGHNILVCFRETAGSRRSTYGILHTASSGAAWGCSAGPKTGPTRGLLLWSLQTSCEGRHLSTPRATSTPTPPPTWQGWLFPRHWKHFW